MTAIVKYTTETGDVELSINNVRSFITGNDQVTEQEFMLFAAMCKAQRLNPFAREAYLIKYGAQPAQMVVGKDVFTKRAQANPDCEGFEAGLYVQTSNGGFKERKGSMVLPGETVIGGWAKVYMRGYRVPIEETISFEEAAQRKKDGTLNKQWASRPGTMCRKVALVRALREAMPADFGGLYDAAEFGEGYDSAPAVVESVQDMNQHESVPQDVQTFEEEF